MRQDSVPAGSEKSFCGVVAYVTSVGLLYNRMRSNLHFKRSRLEKHSDAKDDSCLKTSEVTKGRDWARNPEDPAPLHGGEGPRRDFLSVFCRSDARDSRTLRDATSTAAARPDESPAIRAAPVACSPSAQQI
jgi:hypothetical protein